MARNIRKQSLEYRLRTLLRRLPTLKQLDRFVSALVVAFMIGAVLGGGVWLAGEVIDDLTTRPTVFIDPVDGTLTAGEQWDKVHKMTVWSDVTSSYVDVAPSSPLWNSVLERGDFNVSYAYDQRGIRFPKVEE